MEFLAPDDIFQEEEIQIIHIWLRQRNGRKYITEVNGFASDLNLDKIVKCWRYDFHVSVSRTVNKSNEKVIRLQGDQRDAIYNFLIDEHIIDKKFIKIHGF